MISMRAVFALEDVPPPHPATTVALLGLVVVFWLTVRVQILRRRRAARQPGEQPIPAPAWLSRLARWPGTYPLLALLAAGFVALLVYGLAG